MKKFFDISASLYDSQATFHVYRPASLDYPCDHAVMFVNRVNLHRIDRLKLVHNCIIFCPEEAEIPDGVKQVNVVILCADARAEYCRFFRDNKITCYPPQETGQIINGTFIADGAVIGEDVTILPMAYIGSEVTIGNHVYIGTGVKLVGKICIGDNVVIRENSVVGADGLSTDRDEDGHALTMPQFGGVIIEDNVQIGALTVIARGAIDDTVLHSGCKIDNATFISHNVTVGEDTFVVGNTILFGGSSTGKGAFISGTSTIRNKVKIGAHATVGMGSVVVKNVEDGETVMGNPARKKK